MTDIIIVGEAWGKDEEEAGQPFIGASGRVLNYMLSQVGIARKECYLTNVFNLRPKPSNDVSNLCGPKAEGIPDMPALSNGKYVRSEYAPELERLYREVEAHRPNVIIALGGSAAWALCRTSGIRAIRGAPLVGHAGVKVLPTYHPAAVIRDWTLQPIVLADLEKAKRESAYPEVRRPEREIWVEPTLADLTQYETRHIMGARFLSIDIETKLDQITCIGFAPSRDSAIVVPIFDPTKSDCNYWRTLEDELAAWRWIERICQTTIPKVFQNGLYDIHFLWRRYGITVRNAEHDTMLLHHSLQPEMEKGLGFLGTIYTDEASWKFMRKSDTVKRED